MTEQAAIPVPEDPVALAKNDLRPFRTMIAQAAALAVQDAVANMRSINTVATAAIGAAEQMLAQGASAENAGPMLSLAEASVTAARNNFEAVSLLANKLLEAQQD